MTPLHLEDTFLISAKDTGWEIFIEPHSGAAKTDTAITDPFSPDPLRNRTSVLFLTNFGINKHRSNFLFRDRTATTLLGSRDRLTHNSMILSTREDCFTWRCQSAELPQIHTQSDFLTFPKFQRNKLLSLVVQTKNTQTFIEFLSKDNQNTVHLSRT